MFKLIRRWRKGINHGCGRCHHAHSIHIPKNYPKNKSGAPEVCLRCNCEEYSIERVVWWKVLFGIYDKSNKLEIASNHSYVGIHIPTGESWYILGINIFRNEVCIAGYPPTKAKFSDMKNLKLLGPLSEHEINYRNKQFGCNWD